jgi:transcriptional regulator with XRE-family HTH domain
MAYDASLNGPDPIDVHVGARLRARRKLIGMSQEAVADALGLTFQQVQKYERGLNRLSASKLYRAAAALKVAPAYFFEGLPDVQGLSAEAPQDRDARILLETPEGAQLARRAARLTAKQLAVVDDVMVALIGERADG